MTDLSAEDRILAIERQALDRWSKGDPLGYVENYADDVSYFDDIGAHRRVDGIDAVRQYMSALQGQIPPHDYELVDPRVQVHGDTAVLTTRYHASTDDGPLPAWKATSVYSRVSGDWRVVHAHWSLAKE
jgi:ketosteroid isomerase-like protein